FELISKNNNLEEGQNTIVIDRRFNLYKVLKKWNERISYSSIYEQYNIEYKLNQLSLYLEDFFTLELVPKSDGEVALRNFIISLAVIINECERINLPITNIITVDEIDS